MEGEAMSAHDRHHCKECERPLVEGRAYELGGYRWHVDCFVCSICARKLNADTNMLVLGNGTLVCNNCSYYCNMCHTKIEKLAILTNDQAFCSNCFKCRNCKKPIEDLKYARTPHGIFCMSCHNLFMARKLQRQSRRASNTSASSAHRHKQLPDLPGLPPKPNSRTSSTSTVPQLGSPLTGTPVNGTPRSAGRTPKTAVNLTEDSGSEYEVDPADWGPRATDTDQLQPVKSAESTLLASQKGESFIDTVPVTIEPSLEKSVAAAAAEESKEPQSTGSEREEDVTSEDSSNQLAPSALDATEEPKSSLEPVASRGSTRSSVHSMKTSVQDVKPQLAAGAESQLTPEFKRVSEIDSPSIDFHSARQSLGSNVDIHGSQTYRSSQAPAHETLASPIDAASRSSLDGGESSKFDKTLRDALFNSPLSMSTSLRDDKANGDQSSPRAGSRGGSPPARTIHTAPQTPRGELRADVNIPPRSPARTPSRASSPMSYASSLSLQRSPELLPRDYKSPESMRSPPPGTPELSVPKRSNLRGVSPNARTALARSTRAPASGAATSAPGPLPTSPRWTKNAGANTVSAHGQHKRSFSDNQNIGVDSDNLLRSLVVAQHRIKALESKLSTPETDPGLLERKSTIAHLEARKDIAKEELAALNNATNETKKDAQLSEFSSKLNSMRTTLEEDIMELTAQKEKLKLEVAELVDARDKALEESSLLNTKNSQLADMNNELLRETMEKFGGNQQNDKSHSPSKLWEKRKPRRKEVGSGAKVPQQPHSSSNGGPSPYIRGTSSGFESTTKPAAPVTGQIPPQQGYGQNQTAQAQFVTVLNTQEPTGTSADRSRNKLWPWKRMQRGTPRTVEIDELPPHGPTGVVTHLNGSGGAGGAGGVNNMGAGSNGASSRSSLLGESLEKRVELDGTDVPLLVTKCIEEVEKRGMELEGIYRKSGSKSQIDALMEHFETHNPDTASTMSVDISAVTSALKQYLRYLKDPVITYQNYDDFVRAGRSQNIPLVKVIVSSLPAAHKSTLTVLIAHLVKVKEYGHRNLMTTVNLATVFAPTLTRDITGDREMADMQARNDATQLLIDNFEAIFE